MKYGVTHITFGDYRLFYRFVWSTGFNRPVLDEEIAAEVEAIIRAAGEDKGFQIIEFQIIDSYYVDCIVSAHPSRSVAELLSLMKGISARKVGIAHPDLKYKCYKGKLWNSSYFVETIGMKTKTTVKRYLQNQVRGNGKAVDLETGEELPSWMDELGKFKK